MGRNKRSIKSSELFISDCCGKFTHPVASEIKRQYRIPLFKSLIAVKCRGGDKLIALSRGIGIFDVIGNTLFAFGNSIYNSVISALDTFPSVISIHGEKSSAD